MLRYAEVITNGSYVFGYERREGAIHLLDELPEVE
jgi:hypothetical protein